MNTIAIQNEALAGNVKLLYVVTFAGAGDLCDIYVVRPEDVEDAQEYVDACKHSRLKAVVWIEIDLQQLLARLHENWLAPRRGTVQMWTGGI